jgi:2-dehydro-3-deoxyphosphooctonate aldolase (KDO 8-P synthase)
MGKKILIAGPCVIEPTDVMEKIAEELVRISSSGEFDVFFKASFDKANRTSIHSYRGPGLEKGLQALADIKSKYGLRILTDIHESCQANIAAQVVDVIQIPALLSRQTDLICAAASTGKIVNIKKGQFLSGADMKYPIEKARLSGCSKVWATERGTFFGYNNNVVDFRNIAEMKEFADAVIMDCTHSVQTPGTENGKSGGEPAYIKPMALAGKAFGADGYFFEVHPEPSKALSDAGCILQLDKLSLILNEL